MDIAQNLAAVRATLKPGVTLIAVSKTKPEEAILEAYAAGMRAFGENKVQEMIRKAEHLPHDIAWHFIGNLQRNKVKYLDERVALVHSLDRESLAAELNKNALKKHYIQDVLLEVNIGRDPNKGGCLPEQLPHLIQVVRNLPAVRVKGMMTVIPETGDESQQKEYFCQVKDLFEQEALQQSDSYQMQILSMGMSGDYRAAMECGSNLVRIGTAIFGARNYGKEGTDAQMGQQSD